MHLSCRFNVVSHEPRLVWLVRQVTGARNGPMGADVWAQRPFYSAHWWLTLLITTPVELLIATIQKENRFSSLFLFSYQALWFHHFHSFTRLFLLTQTSMFVCVLCVYTHTRPPPETEVSARLRLIKLVDWCFFSRKRTTGVGIEHLSPHLHIQKKKW